MRRTSPCMFVGILPAVLLSLLFSTCPGRAASGGAVTAWGAAVPSGLTNTLAVASGLGYSLALNSNGTVVGWGNDGTLLTNLPPNLTNVVAIAAGEYHSLALNADGTVTAWGDNSAGQTNVPSGLTNAVAVACGDGHSVALRADGTVSAWGANFASQTNVPIGLSNVVAIAAGGWKSLALKMDGTVVGWGGDSSGDTHPPSDLSNVVAIAAGFEHSLALKHDGTVVTWGSTAYGLGSIPLSATNVVAIAAGESHSLVLKANGSVIAWGANNNGQTSVPADLTNAVAIAGGANQSLAIVNDGSPWIARQPLNQSAYSGTTAELTVGAIGLPTLNYQWQQLNGNTFAVTTNAFLILTNVQPTNAGSYSVVVTNPFGTVVSSKAVLTVVTSAPIIIGSLTDQTVFGGSNATFAISVTGSLPVTYQWQLGGTNLSGATNNPLILTNVQMSQAGAYSVVVSNSFGALASSNAFLNVVPLVINSQPASQSVLAGATAMFDVAAIGQGPFQYQWQFNATNLSGATANSLVLTNVQLTQAGTYSVVVSNFFGASISSNAVLNVFPLMITNQPQNQTVLAGATATFSVAASGQNPFQYQWQYNSTNIDWATNQTLTLTNIQPSQAGAYSVAVSNQFGGVVSSNAILSVLPLAIIGQPQSQFTGVGATVSFFVTASGQGPFSYQWRFQGANLVSETNSSLTLTNVQRSQSGEYSVVVSNLFGTATSSNANLAVVGIVVWGTFNSQNSSLTNMPASLTNVIAMAAGDSHAVALRADGTVVAWGNGAHGQTNVPPDLTNVVSIAAGSTHSLALRSDGTLAIWGTLPPVGNPTLGKLPANATNVVALALGPGAQHALVLRADGTVLDWGNPNYGLTNPPPTARNIVAVASGASQGLALRADGRVVAWGYNLYGGSTVPASATNIVAIAASWYGTAALRADGTTLTWGQIVSPPLSSGFTNAIDLVCPFNSPSSDVLGLRRNGTLMEYSSSPAKYPTNNITAIAAGSYTAFAAVGNGPPVFPGLPVNRTVPTGSRAYFRAVASGTMPISYQWTCNGTNVPGATNTFLALTNVQPVQIGSYYSLVASNAFGSATNGAMYLNEVPMEFYIQPQTASAAVGAPATFSVANMLGVGPFTYQWQYNNTNISDATNASLSLTNLQLNQSGTYSLVASNGYGSVTNTATLSVMPMQFNTGGTNVVMTPNGFQFSLNSVFATNAVIIFASTDLVNWLPILTNPPATGSIPFVDPGATNFPQRYYRASEQ